MKLETFLARRKISLNDWLEDKKTISGVFNGEFEISKELTENIFYYFNNKKIPKELFSTIERATDVAPDDSEQQKDQMVDPLEKTEKPKRSVAKQTNNEKQ